MRKHSISEVDIVAFWGYVKIRENGCWLWAGARNNEGYGIFRHQYAHRFSWSLENGEIPEGHYVCHKCDCPWCVRPSHLFAALPSENSRDMYRKGRFPLKDRPYHPEAYAHLRGENAPSHKLTDEQVRAIKRRHANGETNICALAREYGVSDRSIHKILQGKTWRHISSN